MIQGDTTPGGPPARLQLKPDSSCGIGTRRVYVFQPVARLRMHHAHVPLYCLVLSILMLLLAHHCHALCTNSFEAQTVSFQSLSGSLSSSTTWASSLVIVELHSNGAPPQRAAGRARCLFPPSNQRSKREGPGEKKASQRGGVVPRVAMERGGAFS